jgi:peptidoglycan/LPS O-acetylase OafA/YrhL
MRNRNPVPFLICLVTVFTMGLLSPVPGKALIPVGWTVALLAQRNPQLPLLPKLLDSHAAQYLGAISYPLYLINEPVQRACAMLIAPLAHGSADRFALLWLPAALLLPIAATMLLHHGIEAPAMRWRAMKSKGTRLFTGAETGRRIFSR